MHLESNDKDHKVYQYTIISDAHAKWLSLNSLHPKKKPLRLPLVFVPPPLPDQHSHIRNGAYISDLKPITKKPQYSVTHPAPIVAAKERNQDPMKGPLATIKSRNASGWWI